MSAFTATLRGSMKRCGYSQATLATASNVPHSTLNRYLSGKLEPQQANVEKICQALPKQESLRCAVAWISDHTPSFLAGQIQIETDSMVLKEIPHTALDLGRTNRDLANAIRQLTSMAEHDIDLADALISLAKTLRKS